MEANMGLMDVLNGMQNGPRGNANSSGMSPVTMAVIGLLAYKALKSFTSQPGSAPAGSGHGTPPANANPGGGLGDLLKGGLGGILAGGAAGSVLSGGLGDLLKQFQQAGQGATANTWVGNGPNKSISTDDLAKVLDSDQIKTLIAHTGLSQDQVLAALSQHLPAMVNEMTPDNKLPTEQEVANMLRSVPS
jgi:uncharacterized protein YidB (DUF937 family)